MSARIFCKSGPLAGSECVIQREATIGSGSENRLVLSDPSMPGQQARIGFDDQAKCYFLEDLSGGSTALDGQPVQGQMPLGRLHVITFGAEHDFFFHWIPGELPQDRPETVDLDKVQPPLPHEPSASSTIRKPPQGMVRPPSFQAPSSKASASRGPQSPVAKTVYGKPAGASLPDFLKGRQATADQSRSGPGTVDTPAEPVAQLVLELDLPQGAKRFPLAEGENLLGRSPKCHVFVEDATLSRQHAALIVESGIVRVRDLGSTNKTFVEGKPIDQPTEAPPGKPLAFAKLNGRVRKEKA